MSSTKAQAGTVKAEVLNSTVVEDCGDSQTESTPTVDSTPSPEFIKELNDNLSNAQDVIRDIQSREALTNNRQTMAQAMEDNNGYSDLGCFYAGSTPVANSFGAELGVVTKDQKTNKVQRTGIGFYLRSDHMAKVEFDLSDVDA